MAFTINPLNENDKADWLALRIAADPWPAENDREDILEANWDKIIDPENPLNGLALRKEHELVGYGLYFFSPCIRTSSDECMVRDIFIKPEYRRQGGGTLIMRTIEEKADAAKAGRIFWATHPANETAIAFHKTLNADIEERPEKIFIKCSKRRNLAK